MTKELLRTKLEKHTKELEALAKSREQTDEELKKLQKKRSELSSQVQSFEQQSNAEEDRIFEAFSRSLGVASVREYEEKQLREAKEHEAQVLGAAGAAGQGALASAVCSAGGPAWRN